MHFLVVCVASRVDGDQAHHPSFVFEGGRGWSVRHYGEARVSVTEKVYVI